MKSNWKYGLPLISKVYEANPNGMLRRILERNPGAAEKDTWPVWRAEVLKNSDALEAVMRCYHVNAWRRLNDLVPTAAPPKKRAAAREAKRARVADKFQRAKAVLILNYVMPNRLRLRDCTFGYARELGGAFARIGAMGAPDAIIGDVLSNAQADAAAGEIGPHLVDPQPNGDATRPRLWFGTALLRAAGQQLERWA
jgi:hypothetical protein